MGTDHLASVVTCIDFIAQTNKEAAKEKKSSLMKAMHSLECFFHRFPFFDNAYISKNKYHKLFVSKWYLIFYQIKEDTVYIDYILDYRKDYPWLTR